MWGAQVMPLSAAMFAEWPVSLDEMEPHYRAILSSIPYAAEQDDLAPTFPLFGTPKPLPPLHPRTSMVLHAYRRHRERMQSLGITVGHARLAFNADRCVSCRGLSYGLPALAHLLGVSDLRQADSAATGLLSRRSGRGPLKRESGGKARVDAWEAGANSARTFEADKVYVACGAFGTTRLVLASLERYDQPVC